MKAKIVFEMTAEIEGSSLKEIVDKYDEIPLDFQFVPEGVTTGYEGITTVLVKDDGEKYYTHDMTANQFYEKGANEN